jgi:hypothetical protein
VSLGGADAPGVGPFFHLVQDGQGRFLIAHDDVADEVGVYDSSGSFLRTLGRRGQGPGEWSRIHHLDAKGRFVYVADPGNGRETVLDQGLAAVRAIPLRGSPRDVLVVSDSLRVFNTLLNTSDLAGYPLHVVDLQGRLTASFGDGGGVVRRDREVDAWRRLAAASDGGFWASHTSRYLIERWTIAGERTLTVERAAAWFPDGSGKPAWEGADVPPRPLVAGVWEDAEGLLWVAVAVPDPEWRKALSVTPDGAGYSALPGDYYDTMIEVLDPSSRRVVAGGRFDFMGHFTGNLRIAAYREETAGMPWIDVFRIRIESERRRQRGPM